MVGFSQNGTRPPNTAKALAMPHQCLVFVIFAPAAIAFGLPLPLPHRILKKIESGCVLMSWVPPGSNSHCYDACKNDGDCSDGKSCTQGLCVKLDCGSNADCGSQPGAVCSKVPGHRSVCSFISDAYGSWNTSCPWVQCAFPPCLKMSGQWVPVSESSGKQTVTFQQGVTRSYTVDDSFQWGAQATESVQTGFDVKMFSSQQTITGEVSSSVSVSYSNTFSMTSAETFQYDFDAGTVWQWELRSDGPCGSTTVKGKDLVLTAGAFAPPCCVPNWFMNVSEPHGKCHADSKGTVYTLCDSGSSGQQVHI